MIALSKQARAGRIADALRIAARVLAMLGLLALCLPPCVAVRYWGKAAKADGATPYHPWPSRFLSGIARICGVKVCMVGRPIAGRHLILANHISWLDIPALSAVTGTAFVAQDGLAEIRMLRFLCDLADTVFVARHDPRSVSEQVAAVRAALATSGTLTIFPEGTTTIGDCTLPFKTSLLAALDPAANGSPRQDLIVQPVWLDYGVDSAEIAWVGIEHGRDNFLRVLARRRGMVVKVHLLEPLSTAELASRKSVALAARARILAAMTGQSASPLQ